MTHENLPPPNETLDEALDRIRKNPDPADYAELRRREVRGSAYRLPDFERFQQALELISTRRELGTDRDEHHKVFQKCIAIPRDMYVAELKTIRDAVASSKGPGIHWQRSCYDVLLYLVNCEKGGKYLQRVQTAFLEHGHEALAYAIFDKMCEAGAELKSRVEKAMKGDAKPNKRRECAIRAFLDNVQPGYSDLEIEALVELLEAGITVNRPLFEHYINQPPRPEKRKTKGLTDRQDAGADACAADAADAARSGERPEFVGRKTDYLLQNAHTPEREENVSKYARSFQFEADISEVDVYNHGLHGGGIPGVVERHMAAVKKSAAKGDMSKGLRDAIDRISGERHEYLLREGEVATASG